MNSNFRYVESSLINLLADPAREKGRSREKGDLDWLPNRCIIGPQATYNDIH